MFPALNLSGKKSAPATGKKFFDPEIDGCLVADEGAVALNVASLPRQPPVVRGKFRMRNGIAIEEDEVLIPRLRDGGVENSRATEPILFLPDVNGAEILGAFPFLEYRARVAVRTVVGRVRARRGADIRAD